MKDICVFNDTDSSYIASMTVSLVNNDLESLYLSIFMEEVGNVTIMGLCTGI
jgi:hypothetical protein